MTSALALDFTATPRLSRSGGGDIVLNKKKQASEKDRIMEIFTAKDFRSDDPNYTKKQRIMIEKAACYQVSYDHGFIKPFATTQVRKWNEKISMVIKNGPAPCTTPVNSTPLTTKHKGSVSYLNDLDRKHPGYIRKLF